MEENMGYNKAKEERKWKKWKKDEESILRQEGMSESKIIELRQYDWSMFNSERRFRERQLTNNNLMDYIGTVHIQLPIRNFNDILNQIGDMKLYYVMKNANIQTMAILYLKMEGYSNKEISSFLGLSEKIIRKRINDVKKKLR